MTQAPVAPGESFECVFTVPDAGTYWYHAHNKSWDQVARGLYGAHIVDEPDPPFARHADISLVLDDWRIDRSGKFDVASLGQVMDWSHAGRLSNFMTVNGQVKPNVTVPKGQWLRLRLINAANARILELDPNRISARIIAYDGQGIGEARTLDYAPFLLAPAQRVDLLVKFDQTGEIDLEEISSTPFPFAVLKVAETSQPAIAAPAIPISNLPIPNLDTASTHTLIIEGGAMGQTGAITCQGKVQGRQDFMVNKQFWAFNGIADREQAWRDTFLAGPEGTSKIAFVADNPGKWLFHCHMLEHATAGMTTWFEVV